MVVISVKRILNFFLLNLTAVSRLLSKSFNRMTALSVIIGILSAFVGLWFSYFVDLPTGAVIILLQATIFFSAFVITSLNHSN